MVPYLTGIVYLPGWSKLSRLRSRPSSLNWNFSLGVLSGKPSSSRKLVVTTHAVLLVKKFVVQETVIKVCCREVDHQKFMTGEIGRLIKFISSKVCRLLSSRKFPPKKSFV